MSEGNVASTRGFFIDKGHSPVPFASADFRIYVRCSRCEESWDLEGMIDKLRADGGSSVFYDVSTCPKSVRRCGFDICREVARFRIFHEVLRETGTDSCAKHVGSILVTRGIALASVELIPAPEPSAG